MNPPIVTASTDMDARWSVHTLRGCFYRRRHRFLTLPGHIVGVASSIIGFDHYSLRAGLLVLMLEMVLVAVEFARSYADYQRRMLALEAELLEVRRRGPFGEAGVPRVET